jgi:Ca2+-binding RTX toxin-like protein
MTIVVDIKIHKTNGFDSKYLFPGSVKHTAQEVNVQAQYFTYRHDVEIDGSVKQHLFSFYQSGGVKNGNDVQASNVHSWVLANANDTSAGLASVTITDGEHHVRSTIFDSFAKFTPDLLTKSIDNGEAHELRFEGNRGNDTLRGSYWADIFDGLKGADLMIGGFGDDTYRVNDSGDRVVELADQGYDRIFTKISHTLASNVESLVGTGSRGLALTGNGRPNDISGTAANDTLKGEGGNDVLAAGNGKDVLYGGKGGDFFMFVTPPSASNVDTIKDFKHSADSLILSQYVHSGLTTPEGYYTPFHFQGSSIVKPYSPLNPAGFHASASGKAHDFDDRITYDTTDGRLFLDPDGNGSAPRQLIAVLSGHPLVEANDIFII